MGDGLKVGVRETRQMFVKGDWNVEKSLELVRKMFIEKFWYVLKNLYKRRWFANKKFILNPKN